MCQEMYKKYTSFICLFSRVIFYINGEICILHFLPVCNIYIIVLSTKQKILRKYATNMKHHNSDWLHLYTEFCISIKICVQYIALPVFMIMPSQSISRLSFSEAAWARSVMYVKIIGSSIWNSSFISKI